MSGAKRGARRRSEGGREGEKQGGTMRSSTDLQVAARSETVVVAAFASALLLRIQSKASTAATPSSSPVAQCIDPPRNHVAVLSAHLARPILRPLVRVSFATRPKTFPSSSLTRCSHRRNTEGQPPGQGAAPQPSPTSSRSHASLPLRSSARGIQPLALQEATMQHPAGQAAGLEAQSFPPSTWRLINLRARVGA